MNGTIGNGHEVIWDGRNVWVNSGVDGSSIGRFGMGGVDVHRSVSEQIETGTECLDCIRANGLDGFRYFQASVLKHYGVSVPDEALPNRLALIPA